MFFHNSLPPMLQSPGCPPGSVIAFAGYIGDPLYTGSTNQNQYAMQSPPDGFGFQAIEASGWMVCDGRKLLCMAYPQLFSIIGFLYNWAGEHPPGYTGTLDPTDTFRLPDYRGYFLRMVSGTGGWASNINPDPDVDTARSMTFDPNTKNTTTNGIGSIEEDALQTHLHGYYLASGPPTVTAQPGGSGVTPMPLTPPAANTPTTTPTDKDNVNNPPGKIKVSDGETRSKNMYVYYLIKYV